MNILKVLLLLTFTALVIPSTSDAFIFDKYHVKVRVVDDNGQPVRGADTGISFEDKHGIKMTPNRGLSDLNGYFEASGKGNGYIAYGATKDGYYMSNYSCNLAFEGNCKVTDGEIKILMRKIENPVPMYARDTRSSKIEIPVVGEDVGFDLIKFDWVAPYGLGSQADFIFHLERLPEVSRDNYEATLTISFANKYDGIQMHSEIMENGGQYKLPRTAPLSGYENKLVLHESFGLNNPTKLNFNYRDRDVNYIFRVRSSERNGKLERAMYGKIVQYISFSAMKSKTANIYFRYYLNPDYTRNLEFDPKRNLFDNLKDSEKIGFP